MTDLDAQLLAVLKIGKDVSIRGKGESLKDALKRTNYVELRARFGSNDLRPLITANPSLIEEWIAYSEDKRTSSGWYIKDCIIGQVSKNVPEQKFSTTEAAIAEFVMRELDFWAALRECPTHIDLK